MIVDMRSDISNGLKNVRLLDRETGEPIPEEARGWFYADDEAQVIRVTCNRNDGPGPKVRYLVTPDGMPVRMTQGSREALKAWRAAGTYDPATRPDARREALYPDGSWRHYVGDSIVAWEEIRPERAFRIVVPERAETQGSESL